MKVLKNVAAWLTTPTLLHGVAIGIALALLFAMTWQLSLARTFAALLIVAAFLLLVGAVLGHFAFRQRWSTIEADTLAPLKLTANELLTALSESDSTKRSTALQKLAPHLVERTQSAVTVIFGLTLRFLAIGRLFALLGVVVSFAVFLATYMQVERLSEQNSLLRLQSLSAHQQIALNMRNEVSHVRSLETLANELHGIYRQQSASQAALRQVCAGAEASLQEAIDSLIRDRKKARVSEERCLKAISALLAERSENLEANRLLNQQVTGSGLRLSIFSRDLTEQFTTQFSSICNTDPKVTSEVGRRWTALNEFEEVAKSITEELQKAPDDKTVYLSGPPERAAIDGIQRFLSLAREQAASVRDLAAAVLSVSANVESYLDTQRSACFDRANRLRDNLDRIDGQYEKMLRDDTAS